jgi:glycosyltransferase involved in cell wall biosynthesis
MGGLEARLLNYTDFFLQQGWEVHIACRQVDKKVVPPGVILHKFRPLLAAQGKKNLRFNQALQKWKKPAFDFELSLGRTSIQKNVLAPATHKGYLAALGQTTLQKDDLLQIQMDQAAYNTSAHIFACSKMIRNELITMYQVPEHKVHVLYPPFNPLRHHPFTEDEKIAARKKWGLAPHKIYHVFVSVSHERKGLPLLLEVFKKLTGTAHELLIIGHPVKTDLPNVKSLGFFKETRMAYALGNYLLHPALYEPYGQVINEALHHQIPAIVSKNTGAGEILTPAYGRVMDSFNPDEWYEMIKNLPSRDFKIPPHVMEDLGLDLTHHMRQMLLVNGISLI